MRVKIRARNIPDNGFIQDLQRIAIILNQKTLTKSEYNSNGGRFRANTIERRFRGWNKALEKAGLEVKNKVNISNEELFENIEEVWIKLGRQLLSYEMKRPLSKFDRQTYSNKFGSWTGALKEFESHINYDSENEKNKESRNVDVVHNIDNRKHKTKRNIPLGLRHKVMKRDNYKCVFLGKSPSTNPIVELHIDHKKPWSKGGETTFDNLQTLCSECNLGKSNLD